MIGRVLRELIDGRNMTIQELSEKASLPMETVRNIYYGKVTDPKVSTMMAIAKVFNVSINYLLGEPFCSADEVKLLNNYRKCGNHGKSIVKFIARYEAISAKSERESFERHKVPCLIPHGNIRNGIIYASCETVEVETTVKEAFVSIKMTNNDMLPKYAKGDILLFENRFPENGEYAAFYKTDRAYIRKFIEEDGRYRLKCLHNQGEDIVLRRMDEIEYIGTCCGVIKV